MQHDSLSLFKNNFYLSWISKILTLFGILSLALYVSSNLSNYITVPALVEYFFAVTFFIGIFFRPWQLRNDIAVRLIALSIVLPITFFFINYLSNPGLAEKYFLFENLLRLMIFSAIGFWLGGKLKNIYLFLIFTLACSILTVFNVDIIQNFQDIFNGKRTASGISNSQYTANLFGVLIIGMLCFFKELISYANNNKIIITLYLTCLAVCLTIFLGSQTRAGLLGMDIIYLISIINFLYCLRKKTISLKTKKIFFSYAILAFLILSVSSYNIINKRSVNDNKVVGQLVNKEFDNLKMTSLGIRINSWIEASDWMLEKPLHGWGGKANSYVFKLSNFPEKIKKNFGHFHNSYIEFALSYGIIGLALIIYLFYWVNRQAYLLSIKEDKYESIRQFTLYGTIFTAFINIFESHLYYSIGVYTTAILLAPAYSIYLSKLRVKVAH